MPFIRERQAYVYVFIIILYVMPWFNIANITEIINSLPNIGRGNNGFVEK